MRNMQRLAVSVLALLCSAGWGQVAPPRDRGTYTCKDEKGGTITSDRYIPECAYKEQRLLNPDGSLRQVIPPTLTPEEAGQGEAAKRAAREAQAAQNDAIKYDRLLKIRYPNEAAHNKRRESALDSARLAIQSAEARLQALAADRKRLLDEAEFYRGRPMPPTLKQQLYNNEATAGPQRDAIENQQAEMDRINARFDSELSRLRKLWGGAQPGSLGPPPK